MIPSDHDYPGDDEVVDDFALDLEADICALYSFCSMVQVSDLIKRNYEACPEGCPGWYNTGENEEGEDPVVVHWGQLGQNLVGETAAGVAYEALAEPFPWELGIEVPQPGEYTHVAEYRPVRLDVYGHDGGEPIHTAVVHAALSSPDWRADFDEDDPGADWQQPWGQGVLTDTEFLTLELHRDNPEPEPDELLARYVYIPTAIAYAGTPALRKFIAPRPAVERPGSSSRSD